MKRERLLEENKPLCKPAYDGLNVIPNTEQHTADHVVRRLTALAFLSGRAGAGKAWGFADETLPFCLLLPPNLSTPTHSNRGMPMKDWGRFFRKKQYLVSDVLDDYAADFALRGCRSKKSLRSEVTTLKSRLGHLPVDEITIAVLRRYQAERRGGGLSAATVNKQLAVLSAALNLAATNELIRSVPRFPRRLKPAAPRQGFLEHDDYLAIRAQLPGWGKPVLDFGYYSGWRKNEVLGLTRAEVDLEARQIRLHPSRSKNDETRVLPLLDFGLEAVETGLSTPGEMVFHREDGRRISSTHWHYVWVDAAKAAGRGGLHFHDLRRTVVRRLELGGVPRKTAMAWVGHKTEAIYQRYCITTERDLKPAAEKMLRQLRAARGDGAEVQARVLPFGKEKA